MLRFVLLCLMSLPCAAQDGKEKRWFRGQLHCHSPKSFDWKGAPGTTLDDYMKAMKKAYHFVALSDHGGITDTAKYNGPDFITFPNHETAAGGHVNMINVQKPIVGYPKTLQTLMDAIIESGGLPMINHPSHPEVRSEEIIALNPTKTPLFIEVLGGWEGTNWVHYWEPVLSSGRQIYATGTTDAHDVPGPQIGRSWVEVHAEALTCEAILGALQRGDFYATSGVLLEQIVVKGRTLSVSTSNGDEIVFVGKGGKVFQSVKAKSASFTLPAGELYLRAEARSGKSVAYTQAVFPIEKRGK